MKRPHRVGATNGRDIKTVHEDHSHHNDDTFADSKWHTGHDLSANDLAEEPAPPPLHFSPAACNRSAQRMSLRGSFLAPALVDSPTSQRSLMPAFQRRNSSWLLVPSQTQPIRRAGSKHQPTSRGGKQPAGRPKSESSSSSLHHNEGSASLDDVSSDGDSFCLPEDRAVTVPLSAAPIPPPPLHRNDNAPTKGVSKPGAHHSITKLVKTSPPVAQGSGIVSPTPDERKLGVAMDPEGSHPLETSDHASAFKQNFVMRSIERGTEDWNILLQPFVSDLAFQSVVSKRRQSKKGQNAAFHFRPHHCQAALLFVDLSGYSKITSALAYAGAHAISDCVNSYLSRLVKVLKFHGGDVVKFAGDALMVVWAGDAGQLEVNVHCAARAALELQRKCGVHPVPGTEHSFKIHCGLTSGTLDSEVFCAPKQNQSMPRLYHVISGETVEEIGDLVDLAASGELCVSQNCVLFLEGSGRYEQVDSKKLAGVAPNLGAKLLVNLVLEPDLLEYMDSHIRDMKRLMHDHRQKFYASSIAEDFIHHSVLDALQHGGLSPTQICQMRELCVLFIAMTSTGDAVNWLVEVQEILDRNRCPVVQIIHDDKGVHIVAAINLYEASPETPLLGLKVCRELDNKRVGASVGMAIGPSFVGVTGSVQACRWDITGPAVVRAARLMQYALAQGISFAIDQTVYADPQATTYMTLVDSAVHIKGSRDPCSVYTISDSEQHSASRIIDSDHVAIHEKHMDDVYRFIANRGRSAIVITGAPLVGKKMVCQRAAGKSGLVPYLHVCDASDEFASLARTIATWFRYVEDERVRDLAESVLEDMDNSRWTRAHGQCISLVDMALRKGFRTCFLVDRVQYLDEFSLSIMRECLQSQQRKSSSTALRSSLSSSMIDKEDSPTGKVCFLCVHVPLYGSKSAHEIAQDITREMSTLYVPVIEVGKASREDLRSLFLHVCDMEAEERLLDCYAESSGFAAGYFIERLLGVLSVGGESLLVETNTNFKLQVPPGMIKITKELSVTQICPQIATRYSQIYDDLPLVCQLVLKIVAVANRDCPIPLSEGVIQQVIKSMIAQGIERGELEEFINEMVDIRILQVSEVRDEKNTLVDRGISIQIPALSDIALEVCTPTQVESIAHALSDQLKESWTDNFQTALVCAGLQELVSGDVDLMQQMWRQAFFSFLCESEGWSQTQVNKWREVIRDCIQTSGLSAKDVLDEELQIDCPERITISSHLSSLKTYSPPLALGPLGYTFSIIIRNVVQELGKFNGLTNQDIALINSDMESACGRYMMQVSALEEFLREQGHGEESGSLIENECEMLFFFCNPANTQDDVEAKATRALEQMIPIHMSSRRARLRQLVRQFRANGDLPVLMLTAPPPLKLAYEALQAAKNRSDAAQDALMILATFNWRPHATLEFLPVLHHARQSIPNLRDQTLKQVSSDTEVSTIQQCVEDLEAFLLVTALLDHLNDQ